MTAIIHVRDYRNSYSYTIDMINSKKNNPFVYWTVGKLALNVKGRIYCNSFF